MLSTFLSYCFGFLGVFFGFCMAEGIAEGLTGLSYGLLFIPIMLLGCAIFGAIGFGLGNLIGK